MCIFYFLSVCMLITSEEFHACLWSTILGSVCYFFEKGMVCL